MAHGLENIYVYKQNGTWITESKSRFYYAENGSRDAALKEARRVKRMMKKRTGREGVIKIKGPRMSSWKEV